MEITQVPILPKPKPTPLDKEILEQLHRLLINVSVPPCPKNMLKDEENDDDYRKFAKVRDWLRYEMYNLITQGD